MISVPRGEAAKAWERELSLITLKGLSAHRSLTPTANLMSQVEIARFPDSPSRGETARRTKSHRFSVTTNIRHIRTRYQLCPVSRKYKLRITMNFNRLVTNGIGPDQRAKQGETDRNVIWIGRWRNPLTGWVCYPPTNVKPYSTSFHILSRYTSCFASSCSLMSCHYVQIFLFFTVNVIQVYHLKYKMFMHIYFIFYYAIWNLLRTLINYKL